MIEIQHAKPIEGGIWGWRTDACVKIKPEGAEKEGLPIVILTPRTKVSGVPEHPKSCVEIIVAQKNKVCAAMDVSFEEFQEAFEALKKLRGED